MYQHLKLTIMREYLFIIVLLFSVNVFAQQTNTVEEPKNKSEERKKSNVAPAYSNEVESEMNEVPSGRMLDQVQSSVLITASQNLQQTLAEIKQMSSQKTPTPKQVQKLNYELIKIKNVNENAFEYHLYNYKVGNYNFERIDDLKTAARLQPNHPEVLKSLSAYHYILNDESSLKQHLSKMNAAKHFSSELTDFANDVLHSLPKNSILLTHGDDDTYPLLIEQYVNSTRKDIQIISLDHLQSEVYRERLKKKGFNMPKSNIINTTYFKEFVSLNKNNLVIATSVPKSYLQKIQGQIEVEGLGFRVEKLDKVEANNRLVKLYESTIKPSLQSKNGTRYRKILSNYLPLLFEVRNYWIELGDIEKVKGVESEIIDIARRTDKLEQISKMLK